MILRAIGYGLKAIFYLWLATVVYAVGGLGYQHSGWMGAIGAVLLAGGLVALVGFILVTALVAAIGMSISNEVTSFVENFDPDEFSGWIEAERNHAAAEGIELQWWKRIRESENSMNEKRCDMRGCDNAAKYHYNNPHIRGRYEYCASHLGKLRPEMGVEDWVKLGYATKVYHAKTA